MNDDILRFTFSISPTKPGTEILIAELSQLNFDVFEETNLGVNAYIKKILFDEGCYYHYYYLLCHIT